jgi:hypothetical protein
MERPSRDRPLKLRVDDIGVKVRLLSADCAVQSVRLSTSSMASVWLKPTCQPDPVTGVTTDLGVLDQIGNAAMFFPDAYGTSYAIQTKRVIARCRMYLFQRRPWPHGSRFTR